MPYQPYWKSEFQNNLTQIANTDNLLRWQEVSSELSTPDNPIWEYIYRFNLRNPAAYILIFSSVYKETDRSREVGTDAVRIILVWNTQHGVRYYHIATRYRTDNLFSNIQESVIEAANNCFNLNNYTGWTNYMPY